MHEASLHEENCFLTLTYDDAHLPPDGGLHKEHFQGFIARLRSAVRPKKFSYFHCGEYGENFGRPHYHALLFGLDFADKRFYNRKHGHVIWRSEKLDKLWGLGECKIGSVTYQSAGYIARYSLKKITGPEAPGWYQKINTTTGEIHDVASEYLTMSRNPAIGKRWIEKFMSDCFPCDFVVVDGKKMRVPRYYEKQARKTRGLDAHKALLAKRFARSITPQVVREQTPPRLQARETVKKAALSELKKELQ